MRAPRRTTPPHQAINAAFPPASQAWQVGLRARAEGITGAVHLAVFVEPYLRYVLNGVKTLESRFSKNRCPPYGRVKAGDFMLLKRSGGPVVGSCRVTHVWFFELDAARREEVRARFAEGLCVRDEGFWEARRAAAFASIMEIADVRTFDPFPCKKQDRRGWVILDEQPPQPTLL